MKERIREENNHSYALVIILCFAAICVAQAQSCSNSDFMGIYSALVTGNLVTPVSAPSGGVVTGTLTAIH
jgi:hypothetical protein